MYRLSAEESVKLSSENSKLLITLLLTKESFNIQTVDEFKKAAKEYFIDVPFYIEAVLKRVEVMKLPISFDLSSILSIFAFTDRIGAAMVWLIDILENYENKKVSLQDIINIYPFGFYTESALINRIDFLKDDQQKSVDLRRCKYSYVY